MKEQQDDFMDAKSAQRMVTAEIKADKERIEASICEIDETKGERNAKRRKIVNDRVEC